MAFSSKEPTWKDGRTKREKEREEEEERREREGGRKRGGREEVGGKGESDSDVTDNDRGEWRKKGRRGLGE